MQPQEGRYSKTKLVGPCSGKLQSQVPRTKTLRSRWVERILHGAIHSRLNGLNGTQAFFFKADIAGTILCCFNEQDCFGIRGMGIARSKSHAMGQRSSQPWERDSYKSSRPKLPPWGQV